MSFAPNIADLPSGRPIRVAPRHYRTLVRMVKRPLTWIAYSLGRSARFAPRDWRRAPPSPLLATLGPYWTHYRQLPTPPSSPPRRPRTGCERSSRGSSSGGFRTEDGKRIRRLLVKSRRGWTRSDKRSKGRPAIGKPRTARRFAQARLGDKADAGSRSRSRPHRRRRRQGCRRTPILFISSQAHACSRGRCTRRQSR
jgi:hypothetical protein